MRLSLLTATAELLGRENDSGKKEDHPIPPVQQPISGSRIEIAWQNNPPEPKFRIIFRSGSFCPLGTQAEHPREQLVE